MSTRHTPTLVGGSWLLRTAVAGVLLLAAGAFVLSYSALHAVAVAAGIEPSLAGLYPLIIDEFITIASLAALSLRDHGPRVTWYLWSLLGGFFTVSVWCNALHAASRDGDVVLSGGTAALVSAMPPVALGLAIHLLILMLRPTQSVPDLVNSGSAASVAPTASVVTNEQDQHEHLSERAMLRPSAQRRRGSGGQAPNARKRGRSQTSDSREGLRQRAAAELRKARDSDRELTGAELGRRLGVSTRHGRRLLLSLNGAQASEGDASDHQRSEHVATAPDIRPERNSTTAA